MNKHFLVVFLLIVVNLVSFGDETADANVKKTVIPEKNKIDLSSDLNKDEMVLFNGKELVVTGEMDSSTKKSKTITKEEIDKKNFQDVTEILQKSFNLSIKQNGGLGTQSTFSIRGNSSSQILVLVNGVPINSSQSGSVDISTIPVSSIKKIEVIYGGSDTKYNFSGAMGGIVNIITEENQKTNLYLNLDISNLFYYPDFFYESNNKKFFEARDFFDTQRVLSNFGIGNKIFFWDQSLGADIAANHYTYKDTNNIKRQMNHNDIWDLNCKNSFTFNLPQYIKFVLTNNYFHGDKDIHGSMYNTNYGHQIENTSLSSIFFKAPIVGIDKISAEFSVSHNYSYLNWKDANTDNTHNLNTITAIMRWSFLPLEWFYIQTGGDFTYDNIDSTSVGQKYLFNGGGYFTLEFSIKKIAKIIGSLKINYDKNFASTVPVIPKFGVIFYAGQYITLKSNFYRSFRNPTFNDLYWPKDTYAEGNPDLKPEIGYGGDFIVSYSKTGILNADSSFYANYIQDAILWAPASGSVWKPSNIGKAVYFGSENNIKSDFSKYVELNASYNFLLTYVLYSDYTFESDKRMPYQPMHSFGLGITVNWNPDKKFSGDINLTGRFESERYTDIANANILPSYFTLDISFNQNLSKYFVLYVKVKNALNNYYFLVDKYPTPAGSVTVGVKVKYDTKFKEKKEETNDESI
jgi:vitamin B12 transporter